MFINTSFIDTQTGKRSPVLINSADIHSAKPVRGIVGVDQWEASEIKWRQSDLVQRVIDIDFTTLGTLLEAVNAQ
jgi:hypothetical protein